MINAPCKECKERNVGCHDKCEIYKDYTKERKKERLYMQEKQYGRRSVVGYYKGKFSGTDKKYRKSR